jgi:hypothetical protein
MSYYAPFGGKTGRFNSANKKMGQNLEGVINIHRKQTLQFMVQKEKFLSLPGIEPSLLDLASYFVSSASKVSKAIPVTGHGGP